MLFCCYLIFSDRSLPTFYTALILASCIIRSANSGFSFTPTFVLDRKDSAHNLPEQLLFSSPLEAFPNRRCRALQGNVDIYPGFTGSPLPTPQSFESGIAKEINGSPHLQIALEKPISESNLSGRRNLSDLGLRSASLFDQPSSPSAAGDIKGDSRPNVRKRSSHQVSHPDEETAPPSKSHNRALSGSDTAFDKAPHLSNQSSVLYDSARDAVTSGASPTRHLSGRAQPTKSVRTGFSPTTGVGTHSTVMALPGTSLGTKVGAGSHKFFHSTSSQPFKAIPERTSPMLLQPETRPITQDQLVNEVKGPFRISIAFCLLTILQQAFTLV